MKECKNGSHNLIVITKTSLLYDETEVVRWCKNCGAIVIDGEYDGRTAPGKIRTMEFPEIIKHYNHLLTTKK